MARHLRSLDYLRKEQMIQKDLPVKKVHMVIWSRWEPKLRARHALVIWELLRRLFASGIALRQYGPAMYHANFIKDLLLHSRHKLFGWSCMMIT